MHRHQIRRLPLASLLVLALSCGQSGGGSGDRMDPMNPTGQALRVFFDSTTDISDLPGGVQDEIPVEVVGVIGNEGITATAIELEDEFDDQDHAEVSITGFVRGFSGVENLFFVGAQEVDASTADFVFASLSDGDMVEVEGDLRNGVLIAAQVQF